jgi:hypothetical protein
MGRGKWGFMVGVGSREKKREGTVGEDDSDMWAMPIEEREREYAGRVLPGPDCWAAAGLILPGSAQWLLCFFFLFFFF